MAQDPGAPTKGQRQADGASAATPGFASRFERNTSLASALAGAVVPWAATKRWWPEPGDAERTAVDCLIHLHTASPWPTKPHPTPSVDPGRSHAVFILVLRTARDRLVQVPLVLRAASTQDGGADHSPSPIGTIEHKGAPVDVLDGTGCVEFWQAWAAGATVLAGAGADTEARETLLKATSAVRPMGVEQSNTSVLLLGAGRPFIAKLYRVLHEGTQPEVELPAALAGWTGIPQLRAYLELRLPGASEPCCSAVVTDAVENADDGAVALRRMANRGQDAREVAAAIGSQIAEMHNRLESALGTTEGPATAELRTRLERALSDAAAASSDLTPELMAALERVVSRIAPRAADPEPGSAPGSSSSVTPAAPGRAIRVHGDLHLGQLLRDGTGRWFVVDFEGEPLRSLKERQLPDSPARDLAGMLRSFDYAADSDAVADPSWAAGARKAFLDGYATVRPLSDEDLAVLQAYELEKTLYELQYEVAFRPHWTRIPLAALRRIADQHSGGPAH